MKVSNPLTIIAIFAGLAEALATVALIQLPESIQSIFVYFVMAFPTGIVLLFFAVLYFKNTVLYAPGDYANQDHYLEANQVKETLSQKFDAIFSEINKSGERLTKEEIDNAKNSLNNSIDESTNNSRKEQILGFLSERSATATEISQNLGIHPNYTRRILQSLLDNELVTKKKLSDLRPYTWSLNT
ncbi:winged helix-turn-helix transcriptional regulator [Thalassotalea sp. M1531]|uniref:Winged helix-turn-helix transcriptional regulator n=1 Tax=Thalassotalea algicola TaxID=2716224 RepID=A0A7Y0L8R0_9GAMM|nr:winged helix-turn-helix domain-containing protein [Thalassotalea algicola]NMP30030.1 winged helix-turn-helix transcriptional regulator [Thalassotalea algicola]